MVDTEPHNDKRTGVSRRTFVKAAGASGAAAGLAGCMGGGDGGNGGGDGGGGSGQTDTPINTEPPTEEVTVQFAADSNFKQVESQINEILHDNGLGENITVEVIAGSFTTGDRQAKYQQLLSAGQSEPTILMMDNGWTIPFIARDQIVNLTEAIPQEITSEVQDRYFESMVATASMDGSLYGLPLFADFPTIQYRKDVLREAGYGDSDFETWATESMTWQEFSEVTQAGLDSWDNGDKAGFTFQAAAYEGLSCCDFVEFMSSWGGAYFGGFDNLFGPIGDRPITVDEEAVVNAIRMMRTFINGSSDSVALDGYTDIAPEAVVQYKEESSRKPFTDGNVVMHRNWPYSILINGSEDNFGEDLGVMPIPYAVTESESSYDNIGGISSALGGWHLTLNPNSSDVKKRAAVQVFRALMNDDARLRLFEVGGWIPPIPELVASDQAKELDIIGRYVETLRVAGENSVPRPATVVWPQQSTQISKEVNASLRQQKTPTEAMTQLKAALNQIEQQASQG